MQKYIMISQPMAGLDKETIVNNRLEAIQRARTYGYEVLDSVFDFEQIIPISTRNIPVYYLSQSIEYLSKADAVYFLQGWQSARGCKIEHEIAKEYGIKIIYEDFNDNFKEET